MCLLVADAVQIAVRLLRQVTAPRIRTHCAAELDTVLNKPNKLDGKASGMRLSRMRPIARVVPLSHHYGQQLADKAGDRTRAARSQDSFSSTSTTPASRSKRVSKKYPLTIGFPSRPQ